MVVNLSISQWSARKHDKTASAEVERNHGAHDAGRFNKLLLAQESIKEISKIAGSARTFHYENTLPWSDNGDRVLPAGNYFTYTSKLQSIKMEFEDAVYNFCNNYDSLVSDAKVRLNSLFNQGDYPHPSQIASKFSINVSFMPVPDVEDFRVSLTDDEVMKIKSEISNELSSRVDQANSDLIQRCKDAVSHMAVTLSDPDKVFRDSLVNNIFSLVNLIPALNFSGNANLSNACVAMGNLCVDPEQLRTVPAFRKEIADKAKAVLNTL